MTALAKLKLVSFQADRKSPMILRRAKLTGQLGDQIALRKSRERRLRFAAKKVKFVTDTCDW